ncbi:MAG: 3-isopropylmalate dehydratase [Candidatus Methanogaster sp.]|uniref:3-isopropylmalate dehydratase n=1 Tax=Candidatus Methanogaster sp. TaxID=3386292 RepID=A0AC61L4H0_9EURY|nr:MAG: 3-isopropylmalate dehydratase [ANME-2 cluster archaeon]
MEKYIKGRVWRFSENVDTDQIIPAIYLVTGDRQELAKHAFENVRPDFAKDVSDGDIIVAGPNFGSGSSREHAPRALLGAGIKCVIAPSFARIFYRNSINIGLPLVECDVDAADGDVLAIDFEDGKIVNTNTSAGCTFPSLPDFLVDLLDVGLIENTKRKLMRTG